MSVIVGNSPFGAMLLLVELLLQPVLVQSSCPPPMLCDHTPELDGTLAPRTLKQILIGSLHQYKTMQSWSGGICMHGIAEISVKLLLASKLLSLVYRRWAMNGSPSLPTP